MSLDKLGITKQGREEATGEFGGEFKVLPCGIHDAVIKEVVIWNNKFGNKTMQYFVKVLEDDRIYSYKDEVSAMTKEDKQNKGYVNRFVQFEYAANVNENELTFVKRKEQIKSYGEEYDAYVIPEFTGKKVKAVIRLWDDESKSEGENYKITVHLFGVLAPNNTDPSGEDKTEKIKELCEKGPIKWKPKGKASGTPKSSTPNEQVQKAAAEVDF